MLAAKTGKAFAALPVLLLACPCACNASQRRRAEIFAQHGAKDYATRSLCVGEPVLSLISTVETCSHSSLRGSTRCISFWLGITSPALRYSAQRAPGCSVCRSGVARNRRNFGGRLASSALRLAATVAAGDSYLRGAGDRGGLLDSTLGAAVHQAEPRRNTLHSRVSGRSRNSLRQPVRTSWRLRRGLFRRR